MATIARRIAAGDFPGGRLTAEEFWELPGAEGKQYELVEGVVVEMPTPGGVHNYIAFTIAYVLRAFVDTHPLGFVLGDNMGYILRRAPDTVRIPDASFISFARGGTILPVRDWPLAPDLAVEVVSPSNREAEVREKVGEYLTAGASLVWVVRPEARSVTLHTTDDEPHALGEDGTLDGGNVLPGFAVPVARLFPPQQ